MSNPTLQFISNPSNEGEGLSDAGVETFRDRPYFSVAREAGQNSRDAQADVNQPVKMVFKEHLIDTRDFPSHDEYLKVINLCLNKSSLLLCNSPRSAPPHAGQQLFDNACLRHSRKYLIIATINLK